MVHFNFGATVTSSGSATGPLSCLSVLSVTLVYCGQTVWWIKMPLGTEVGVGLRYIVLYGDPASLSKKEQSPSPVKKIAAHVYCDQTAG